MNGEKEGFSEFTCLYEVNKTLRFELKPVGETLEKMIGQLGYDKDLQTFLKDQDIEDAYQTLKPITDDTHEEFITNSLESEEAKKIDFQDYLEKYKNNSDDKGEKELYSKIGKLYEIGEQKLKEKAGTEIKRKGGKEKEEFLLKEKGYKCLTEKNILTYIKKQYLEDANTQNALKKFEGFFTYFGGFNENRENYYKTEGKKGSIAKRIIDENLPKFCDNHKQFFDSSKKDKNGKETTFYRKDEYGNAYQYLKNNGKNTQIKDAESGEYIEAHSIEEKYFEINYFNSCLSQYQIEEYNKIIGHYNLLINLYNQAKKSEEKDLPKDKKDFEKLPQFKILYKQIGCGKKESLFFSLKYDREEDIQEEDKKLGDSISSVEQVLKIAKEKGKKYFSKNKDTNSATITIPYFIEWLKEEKKNWKGIYWSSKAINTISNKYFAN